MVVNNSFLTVDSNVSTAALRGQEYSSKKCENILRLVPDQFILAEA